jgi:hypothetical protein
MMHLLWLGTVVVAFGFFFLGYWAAMDDMRKWRKRQ